MTASHHTSFEPAQETDFARRYQEIFDNGMRFWCCERKEPDVSFRMVIELQGREGAQTVVQALDAYKVRLHAGIARTRRRLATFEVRYGVNTAHFLRDMTAEDLAGGDLEYVEWAGEAKLLEGLEAELRELEHARYQLP
jgi:hypothetical protein